MSDGVVLKADKDYSKEVDKQIPEAKELAKVSLSQNVFESRRANPNSPIPKLALTNFYLSRNKQDRSHCRLISCFRPLIRH